MTTPPALQLTQLCKTYNSGVEALKGIDLTVHQGDFFALLGPNGAGKSTAIGIISSLVNKSSGQVAVFGHDLDHEKEQAKACIGLVPQEFNFNVFEKVLNIVTYQGGFYGMNLAAARASATDLLKQLSLWDKRNTPSRELSGGMKRRLMIARALVHRPRLLILDEPTAGVDIEIRKEMWGFLRRINEQGVTVILTTHYLEEAEQLCRNIAIINHGGIVEHSTMPELLGRLHAESLILNSLTALPDPLPLNDGQGLCFLRRDDRHLEVEVARGATINGLFQQLDAAGIQVQSLRNSQNRLEKLFLDLVKSGTAS